MTVSSTTCLVQDVVVRQVVQQRTRHDPGRAGEVDRGARHAQRRMVGDALLELALQRTALLLADRCSARASRS